MDNEKSINFEEINPEELILTNGMAEAQELKNTRDQLKASDELMEDIRRVNLKNIELQEQISQGISKLSEMLESMPEAAATEASATEPGTEPSAEPVPRLSPEFLEELDSKLKTYFEKMENTIHREDVKVYKNVQAHTDTALGKQKDQLLDALKRSDQEPAPGDTKITVLLIITMIVSLANLVIWVLDFLGILGY